MIYLSLYYFIGGAIILPSVTYISTRWWYVKKIDAIMNSTDIEMSPNSIEDAQEISPSKFSFAQKQEELTKKLQF